MTRRRHWGRFVAVDPPPVGETGIEISGSDAFDLVAERMRLMTAVAREQRTLLSVKAEPLGRWVGLRLVFKGSPQEEVIVRVSKAWAVRLREELSKVVHP